MTTIISVVVGAVLAAVLTVGGVAALRPSVDQPVKQADLVQYGDN